jgi:hydroxymethylglutaryl-CoA synthase
MCELRKKAHLQKDYKPLGDASTITSGTYYLENIDDMFKRFYSIQA